MMRIGEPLSWLRHRLSRFDIDALYVRERLIKKPVKSRRRKVQRTRSTTAVDVEIGQKIRARRTECGFAQGTLAEKLGISFQQVQKYEKGINRVSTSRLGVIAKALDVPFTDFFNHVPAFIAGSQFKTLSPISIRALRAYSRISSKTIRRRIVILAEELAETKR